jgi:hypothetical protein
LAPKSQATKKTNEKNISTFITVAVLAAVSAVTTNAATQVYHVKTDWSDAQNANGSWSYRDAGTELGT